MMAFVLVLLAAPDGGVAAADAGREGARCRSETNSAGFIARDRLRLSCAAPCRETEP